MGGIREKLLAAIRHGIPEVVVPRRNAEEVLRLARENLERNADLVPTVVRADAFEFVRSGDDEFDLTYSFKVLAHVPEIRAALVELARVTAPGGHLALEFYNPWSLRYAAKRLAGPQPISAERTTNRPV